MGKTQRFDKTIKTIFLYLLPLHFFLIRVKRAKSSVIMKRNE